MASLTNQGDQRRLMQMILQQVDQLPTLSSIALRLIEATSSETSHAREVIALVSGDPSLSSRVLQLLRRSNRGVNLKDAGIDRAVLMLGFDEVRSLTLAVEVFELMDGVSTLGGERHGPCEVFERQEFWRHSIAVAVAAESLVRDSSLRRSVGPGEAFLAGLLHDLGHLAMHTLLPRTFDRICALAESRHLTIDAVCRRMLGMGAHTIGKRLAEHWQLPAAIRDVIWLCSQPRESLPEGTPHELIRVVTLADAVARGQLLAHAGHLPTNENLDAMAREIGLEAGAVARCIESLHDEVAARCAVLGLGDTTSTQLLRESVERTTRLLSRRAALHERDQAAMRMRTQALAAEEVLFDRLLPGDSLTTVVDAVHDSAQRMFGDDIAAAVLVIEPRRGRVVVFPRGVDDPPPQPLQWELGEPFVPRAPAGDPPRIGSAADWFPWLEARLVEQHEPALASHLSNFSAIELDLNGEAAVYLLLPSINRDRMIATRADVLARLWGSVLSAAVLQERLGRLSEGLVEANRRLVEAQEHLAERRAMAALGELALGAAHEMNNPLTVISGRSQILARRVEDPSLRDAAEEICRQAHRLSDLITSLSLYADAPVPKPVEVEVLSMVNAAIEAVRLRVGPDFRVQVSCDEPSLPPVRLDPNQIGHVLRELLQNAQEAAAGRMIEVRVQIDPLDDRLMVSVIDDGPGLSEKALVHAFDPFFSEKPAGRRAGLGLARARRLADLNRGELELKNGPEGGAVATLLLRNWRGENAARRAA